MKKRVVLLVLLLVSSLVLVSCGGGSSLKKNVIEYAPGAIQEIFDLREDDDIEILKVSYIATYYKDDDGEDEDVTYYFSFKYDGETYYIEISCLIYEDDHVYIPYTYDSEQDMKDDYDESIVWLKGLKKYLEKGEKFSYANGDLSKAEINTAFNKAKE